MFNSLLLIGSFISAAIIPPVTFSYGSNAYGIDNVQSYVNNNSLISSGINANLYLGGERLQDLSTSEDYNVLFAWSSLESNYKISNHHFNTNGDFFILYSYNRLDLDNALDLYCLTNVEDLNYTIEYMCFNGADVTYQVVYSELLSTTSTNLTSFDLSQASYTGDLIYDNFEVAPKFAPQILDYYGYIMSGGDHYILSSAWVNDIDNQFAYLNVNIYTSNTIMNIDNIKTEYYDNGYTNGFDIGYTAGYNEGIIKGGSNTSFLSLMGSIADTPILMIRSLFNFDIFGTSVAVVVLSLITGLIILGIVKRFI